jgi:hypothetical protein
VSIKKSQVTYDLGRGRDVGLSNCQAIGCVDMYVLHVINGDDIEMYNNLFLCVGIHTHISTFTNHVAGCKRVHFQMYTKINDNILLIVDVKQQYPFFI